MLQQRVVAAAIWLLACGGCAGPPILAWEPTPEGERIARRWLEQSQRYDAFATFEMLGMGVPIRFAVVRKWHGDSVSVLSYVVAPASAADTAFLTRRRPGQRGDTLMSIGPRGGVAPQASQLPPGSAAATSVGAEVAQPVLPGDYVYRDLPDARVGDDPCFVLEARPPRRLRGFTHLRLWISQRTGVALRKVYYEGEEEVRRVSAEPEDVREFDGRLVATRRQVRTRGGAEAEIILHRLVPDPPLPDSVFSERALRARRFPRF